MGIPSIRLFCRRLFASRLVAFGIAAAACLGVSSCDNNESSSKVAPELFVAPVAEPASSQGLRVLLDKFDILAPIDPSLLRSEVLSRQADLRVLAELPDNDLLLYEGQSRSVLTMSQCLSGCGPEPVRLHYSATGLSEAQGSPQSSISTSVDPVLLRNGWVLAFDSNTRNIVAFKKAPTAAVTNDNGVPIDLPFRRASNQISANFGQGNGLFMSIVISGEQLDADLAANVITRMFEIEDNKVVVLFATLPSMHILDLREEMVTVDYDLDITSPSDFDRVEVPQLRGRIELFPRDPSNPTSVRDQPFLSFRTISERVTDSQLVNVSDFAPVTLPDDGSALFFDTETFTFFRVRAIKQFDPSSGTEVITGGFPVLAVSNLTLFETLRESAGLTSTSGPFTMTRSFFHPTNTELCVMEEETNNIVCYDYTRPNPVDPTVRADRNLRVFVSSNNLALAFDPQGIGGTGSERELVFATADVRENRLAFDRRQDQLLSISYSSGNVVVTARRADLIQATGGALADLIMLRPLTEENVRMLDAQAVALLEAPLNYEAFPVEFSN